jgi:hypothetical protein
MSGKIIRDGFAADRNHRQTLDPQFVRALYHGRTGRHNDAYVLSLLNQGARKTA